MKNSLYAFLFHNPNLQHITNTVTPLTSCRLAFQVKQSSNAVCGLEVRSQATVTNAGASANALTCNSITAGNELQSSAQGHLVPGGVVES